MRLEKILIIIVIIALLFAIFSVTYSLINSGKKISTQSSVVSKDTREGQIGINILPPPIEGKNG